VRVATNLAGPTTYVAEQARTHVMSTLFERVSALGVNAVVGVHFVQSPDITSPNGGVSSEVVAYGSAAVARRSED
jgi:uncharacterized protein YbjQ (UPF0145 family)